MNKSKLIKHIVSLILLFVILLISFNVTSVQDIICNSHGIAVSYVPNDKIEIFNPQGEQIGIVQPAGHGWKRLVNFDEYVTVYFVRDNKAFIYDYAGNRISDNADFRYNSSANTVTALYHLSDEKTLRYNNFLGYETLTIESRGEKKIIYHSTIFYVVKSLITLAAWAAASLVFNRYFDLITKNAAKKT